MSEVIETINVEEAEEHIKEKISCFPYAVDCPMIETRKNEDNPDTITLSGLAWQDDFHLKSFVKNIRSAGYEPSNRAELTKEEGVLVLRATDRCSEEVTQPSSFETALDGLTEVVEEVVETEHNLVRAKIGLNYDEDDFDRIRMLGFKVSGLYRDADKLILKYKGN